MFKLKRPNIDPDPALIRKVNKYSRIAAILILLSNIALLIYPYFFLGVTSLFGSVFETTIISIILLFIIIDYRKYYRISLSIFIIGIIASIVLLFVNPILAYKLLGLNYYPSYFWLIILQLINVISVAMLFSDNDAVIYI